MRTVSTRFAERARTEAMATVRMHREDEDMARTGGAPKNQSGVGRHAAAPAAPHVIRACIKGPEGRTIHELSTFEDGETLDAQVIRVWCAPVHRQ
jgi:hypothetical protein